MVDVDDADGAGIGAVVREGELEVLVLALDVLGVDRQGAEDGQVDDVGVRAGAGHDDNLVQNGEGEGAGGAREEWQLGRDEVEEAAVVAVLLALLTDDGADERDE